MNFEFLKLYESLSRLNENNDSGNSWFIILDDTINDKDREKIDYMKSKLEAYLKDEEASGLQATGKDAAQNFLTRLDNNTITKIK